MAAYGRFQSIFDKALPESPTLLESLSPWHQIKSPKTATEDQDLDSSSFTEIFGELHFKESIPEPPILLPPSTSLPLPSSYSSSSSSPSASSVSSLPTYLNPQCTSVEKLDRCSTSKSLKSDHFPRKQQYVGGSHKNSDSFSSFNSESSRQLCTEGLGFESSDDVEDYLKTETIDEYWQFSPLPENVVARRRTSSRACKRTFPPPISCIGRKSGKPWVSFKSYRYEGRFVLNEVRIPTQEFLHARRENGRLKLRLVQSDDENFDDDEEQDGEENQQNVCNGDTANAKEEETHTENNVQLNSNRVGGES